MKESAKKARQRLTALDKREEVLLEKIDQDSGDQVAGDDEDDHSTANFAKMELAKIRYERRALVKKLKTCELNKRSILAEIEVVGGIEPENPLQQNIQFKRPIKGRISSEFGMRFHPIEHVEKPHHGIDLAGDFGDSVKACAKGRVTFAGIQRGYGKIVIIKHLDGLSSAYGHLSDIRVQVGDTVSQGEKIGEVGMSGNSTGPHLHFEIRENGSPVNPGKYL